jgi:hypothetical protein
LIKPLIIADVPQKAGRRTLINSIRFPQKMTVEGLMQLADEYWHKGGSLWVQPKDSDIARAALESALRAALADARRVALEEAANLAVQWGNVRGDDHAVEAFGNCAAAIRSLIEPQAQEVEPR